MLLQRDLTGRTLAGRILVLAADRDAAADGRGRARMLAQPDAARVIVDRAMELAGDERFRSGSGFRFGFGVQGSEPRTGIACIWHAIVLGKTRRVHFIGIGGIGMSGIAELLANLGYIVSGSDEKRSAVTERLATLGIRRRRTGTRGERRRRGRRGGFVGRSGGERRRFARRRGGRFR